MSRRQKIGLALAGFLFGFASIVGGLTALAADSKITLNPGSGGSNADTESVTTGAGTVERGRTEITGSGASEVARVLSSAPAGTEYGLVVRPIAPSTQVVSQSTAASLNATVTQGAAGATAWKVDGSATTQPVSGTLTCNAGSGTLAVSDQHSNITSDYDTGAGAQTMTMYGIALPASGGSVAGGTSTNPVRTDPTGTTTQPVSGTVTANVGTTNGICLDATLTGGTQRAKVTDGTNNAAVKAASTAAAATDPALVVSVSPNNSVAVTGTFWQATQPVSGTVTAAQATAANLQTTATLASMGAASSTPTGVVSIGNSLGKTLVMKTGSLASSAATADQVVLTYTVTSGKTFYLTYLKWQARLTTYAATATNFGTISLETPSGTKVITEDIFHAGIDGGYTITFSEPLPIASAAVIRVVCTPSAVTAFTWKASFGGYEK
jgi:hypothetical protein